MHYRFIDEMDIGIANLDLELLELQNPYSVLLYQHKGNFQPTAQKFGDSDQALAHKKFIDFISLARKENVSLAMTPEYSCPWSVIREILVNNDLRPSNGKLFVLGCESITPPELIQIKKTLSSPNIAIYFDENVLDRNGNFFDTLCYIFKNDNRLYLIVQFKTHHMGVWVNPIERDNYKSGNEIYVLRNNIDSIYLFSLICSEAMNFEVNAQFQNEVDHRWMNHPYIILNPQLNPKPNNPEFRRFYERILFDYQQKDLICLNWCNGSTIGNNPFISFGRSGLFIRTHHIKFNSDAKFMQNHSKGVYYLNNKKDVHSFYLCSHKNIYKVRCQKPLIAGGVGVQIMKTEPEVLKVLDWNGNIFDEVQTIHDRLTEFLDEQACPSTYLRSNDVSCVDKERLVMLSNGQIDSSEMSSWFYVNKLVSYELNDSWVINRITFLEDEDGRLFRISSIRAIAYLNVYLLGSENYWPPLLNSFKGEQISEVKYDNANTSTKYLYNFLSGKGKATVAYLDFDRRNEAQKVLDRMKNLFQDQSRNRIIVWFKTSLVDNNFSSVTNGEDNSISEVEVYNSTSINK